MWQDWIAKRLFILPGCFYASGVIQSTPLEDRFGTCNKELITCTESLSENGVISEDAGDCGFEECIACPGEALPQAFNIAEKSETPYVRDRPLSQDPRFATATGARW